MNPETYIIKIYGVPLYLSRFKRHFTPVLSGAKRFESIAAAKQALELCEEDDEMRELGFTIVPYSHCLPEEDSPIQPNVGFEPWITSTDFFF